MKPSLRIQEETKWGIVNDREPLIEAARQDAKAEALIPLLAQKHALTLPARVRMVSGGTRTYQTSYGRRSFSAALASIEEVNIAISVVVHKYREELGGGAFAAKHRFIDQQYMTPQVLPRTHGIKVAMA